MTDSELDDLFGPESGSGGATGIFGQVVGSKESPANLNTVAPPPNPPVEASPIAVQSVAFQVNERASHGDTDALRRLLEGLGTPAVTPPALANVSSTSKAPAIPSAVTPSSEEPSPSFTALFGTAPGQAAAQSTSVASGAGSFTQLFAKITDSPSNPPSFAAYPSTQASAQPTSDPGWSGGVPAPVFSSPTQLPSPNTSGPASGGLTQLLQAFKEARPAVDGSVSSPPVRFQTLEQLRVEMPAAAPSDPVPGSFTQLFQSIGSSGSSPKASAGPEVASFTQQFSALAQASVPTTQADAFPPLTQEGSPDRSFGSGSALAPTLPAANDRFAPMPIYDQRFESGAQPPQSSGPGTVDAPAMGGLTQLLRKLDGPSQHPAPTPARMEPISAPFMPSNPFPQPVRPPLAPEGATVAFQIQPPSSSMPAPEYPQPAVSSGPSEFTRILHASGIRESLRQGGSGIVQAGAHAAAPQAQVSGSDASMPGFSAMPSYPAMPQMPQMAMMGSSGMPQMQPMQTPAMQMTQMLQAPAAPAPAVPAAGMKAWVPILLIVIIVLLVGILLTVVLLMKK